MLYKKLKILSLGLLLSTTTSCCFSADNDDRSHPNQPSSMPLLMQGLPPIKLAELASNLFKKMMDMENSLQKAESFEKAALLAKQAAERASGSDEEVFTLCKTLSGTILRQQAGVLYNISVVDNPSEKNNEQLRKALKLIEESCSIFKEMENKQEEESSSIHLPKFLSALSMNSAVRAEAEQDADRSLSLFIESIACVEKKMAIKPKDKKNEKLSSLLALSLHKTMVIYDAIDRNVTRLYEPSNATVKGYKELINNANLTKKLFDYLEKYIINSVNFIVITSEQIKKPKGKKGKEKASPSPKSETRLNPEEFIKLPRTTYCSALKKASLIAGILASQYDDSDPSSALFRLSQSYREKEKQHLQEALEFYQNTVYEGEYKETPELENDFILARLDDIIGNPEPLREFYKLLRRKKLAEAIKYEQEIHHKQEEEQRQKAEKRSQEQEAKKEAEVSPERESAVHSSSSSSLSDLSFVSEPSQKASPPKEKIKTRGVANPPPMAALQDAPIIEKEREKIVLSSNHYRVFQVLTGTIYERKISLIQVKQLLEALRCKIGTGKGAHQKARAQNGMMWTIPGAWDGPIPDYYRQQLNEFLQNAMNIEPDDVVTR